MKNPSVAKIRILFSGILLLSAACLGGKDFGDFYTRAWYLVVDNPGPARSLSNPKKEKALLRWGYPTWMRPFDVGFRVVVEE